jgi:cytosine/adenosine deaminase-related metal-dependent hydrolase
MAQFNDELLHEKIDFLARTGTATVGAVSSYGYEINALASSPLRVVLFNEAIGSKPDLVDTMFSHFISRVDECEKLRSPLFTPAIAIHSPYSVHPDLVTMALGEVKEKGYVVSTHFMESPEERKWLDHNEGKFAPFFKNFLQIEQAFTSPQRFLESFESLSPLITHAIHTTNEDHALFQKLHASVIHCPVSNRLLGAGVAPLSTYKAKKIPIVMGTDGLSSNISLSLFDEMRAALMVHAALPLEELAIDLFKGCTSLGAQALKTNNGSLETGKKADIAITSLPDVSPNREDFFTQLILQTQEVDSLYIEGKKYVRKS